MEDLQHDVECEKIKDGADRANIHHEVPNESDVPPVRFDHIGRIDVVRWYGYLGKVIEKVIQ